MEKGKTSKTNFSNLIPLFFVGFNLIPSGKGGRGDNKENMMRGKEDNEERKMARRGRWRGEEDYEERKITRRGR